MEGPDSGRSQGPGADRSRAVRVSVVVPAHNGEGVIGAALGSLAAQTYPDVEWVVVDDASRDRTAEVVREMLGRTGVSARLIRHSENWGLSRTLNHGIRESSGEFILIVHQDITLVSPDWIARAVADLDRDPDVAVVTGNYGIPPSGRIRFAERVFGVLRRQFHHGPESGSEFTTFTEFKCDLARRTALRAVGGFPERFRIAGEDLWVSYSMAEMGQRILKDYTLRSVQRFTGDATSVRGNLRKEYLFGKVLSATLLRFRGRVARGLGRSPYARSRSWNRASQPIFLLAALVLLVAAAITGWQWLWIALGALVLGRWAYYVLRLFPGLRRIDDRIGGAWADALSGAFLGLASDACYSTGLVVGLASSRSANPL